MPGGWDCVPLVERLNLEYGRALPSQKRQVGDVRVYGSNGPVGSHNVEWLTPPGIVVGRKGTVGAVHYAATPFWPIDTAYYVRLLSNKDNLRYVFHLLQYLPLRLLNAATGVPGLSRRDAFALRGMFPPHAEQIAIAGVLDDVGAVIADVTAAREKAVECKRAMAQSLLTRGLTPGPAQSTVLGPLPMTWEAVPVKTVVSQFQYGLSLAMQPTGTLPILRMGNIQNGDVVLDNLKYVTVGDALSSKYVLSRGDVLFNRTNSLEHVGKVGVFRDDRPCVFASYLIRLHIRPELVDSYYLGQVLSSYATQCRIRRYATPGVQQVNINATNLARVLIPVPLGPAGLDTQREIAQALEDADALIRGFAPLSDALVVLEQSLRRELLSGRIRPTVELGEFND